MYPGVDSLVCDDELFLSSRNLFVSTLNWPKSTSSSAQWHCYSRSQQLFIRLLRITVTYSIDLAVVIPIFQETPCTLSFRIVPWPRRPAVQRCMWNNLEPNLGVRSHRNWNEIFQSHWKQRNCRRTSITRKINEKRLRFCQLLTMEPSFLSVYTVIHHSGQDILPPETIRMSHFVMYSTTNEISKQT